MDAGIDYGRGLRNIDLATGIRYGVINQNEVLQAWCDSSEAHYTATCPYCGNDLTEYQIKCLETIGHCEHENNGKKCGNINDGEQWPDEPLSYIIDDDEYIANSDEQGDIMIIKSPYYTYAQFCSPCALGAGHLMDWFMLLEMKHDPDIEIDVKRYVVGAEKSGFPKVYCFGHDWFDEVETGEIIECRYCEGRGKRIYPEHSPIYNNGKLQTCHNCDGAGKVKKYIQKAPYPVFSIKTGELVNP